MRFASLGSGSEGNGLLVETGPGGATAILIDCGFGVREAEKRLRALGREPSSLAAVIVTHEHGDHIRGAFRLAVAHGLPVHLTHGTWRAAQRGVPAHERARISLIDPHAGFEVGDLRVEPIPVPHDANEPVQFVIDDGRTRLGVLTDLGHGTAHVVRALSRLDALVLECNHDPSMLAANRRYPPSLKQRIGGAYGHLANAAAADILGAIDRGRLRRVVAAHLSRENNQPALATQALASVLDVNPTEIDIADQDGGLAWVDLGAAMHA
ncbi:MAG: MBL fold metallo-hydrolase [Burkholderiaceae bacterium]|nr:MBL fold metallo-hydrolase [Burkholderiaceae bacterium]